MKQMTRSTMVVWIILATLGSAHAQNYPVKPIRWIVPFSPGGITDTATRVIAPKLSAILGQPVVVENRPGASGVIGTELVAKAAPDGYTLLLGAIAPLAISPNTQKNLPYDPVKDFAPISQMLNTSMLLIVHPSLGVNSLNDLIALAKSRPGQLDYGSNGNGTAGHITMELLKMSTGINITHVPYGAGAQAVTDLLGGHVQLMFDTIAVVGPHVKAGKVKALAISSPKRVAAMPEIPTVAEAGNIPGFYFGGWAGLVAPAGTPADIVTRLHQAIVKILATPEIQDMFSKQYGMEAVSSTPEQFAALIKTEIPKLGKVIASSGPK